MKETQCEKVLKHLNEFGSITAAEAITEYGIYRLASRIADLKKQNYLIMSETVKGKNRFGEKTSFKRYFLPTEDDLLSNHSTK